MSYWSKIGLVWIALLGICMLMIAAFSAYSIYARSLKIPGQYENDQNILTLWAITILGFASGIWFLSIALPLP